MAYQKTAQQIPGSGSLVDELTRWTFVENFKQKPGIAGDSLPAATSTAGATYGADVRLATGTNKDWMVAGTNGTSALCTHAVGGGITLTTAGADNDQEYILPNTDGSLNALETIKFDPGSAPLFATAITTGASVASAAIFAGFVLTVPAPLAWGTDADQVVIALDTDTSANWYVRYSIAGNDYAIDTGITPAASTTYRFVISVDEDAKATCLINDTMVHKTPALTGGANLIPTVGVQALTGAAKAATCRKIILAKNYEDAQ